MCEDGAFKVLGVVVGWKLCFQAVGVAAVMVVLCVGSNGLFVGEELLRSGPERSVCRLLSRKSGKHKSARSLSSLSSLSSIDVTMMSFAATLLQHKKSLLQSITHP
jgi:hypothetical protein